MSIEKVFVQQIEENEIIINIGGITKVFPILMIYYSNNKAFIALFDEEKDEINIFRIIEDENKESYIQIIEDENEWKLACEAFYAIANKVNKEEE